MLGQTESLYLNVMVFMPRWRWWKRGEEVEEEEEKEKEEEEEEEEEEDIVDRSAMPIETFPWVPTLSVPFYSSTALCVETD
ncbi:hypothetical protein M0802_004349 [Mischocyttarus mexicanus]|nr:hypothetical protein M0802_004349 [Mischocyttarus mexicanus]